MRWLIALFTIGLAACGHAPVAPTKEARVDEEWLKELARWKEQRRASIAGEEGWITLCARAWLKPGANRFGSDEQLELVLPADRAPRLAGTITLEGDRLRIHVEPGVSVLSDGRPVTDQLIADDRDQNPTMMTLGSLTMHVIKRQDRYALRVKDREHPARKAFSGLHYYPPDPRLRVTARLEPAPAGKTIPIVNVLDQTEQMPSPGTLRFSLDGVAYSLDAVIEPGEDELFILFRDETAGHGTYPSGRFLYAKPPGPDGIVALDFNRAYNPPCAFTDFATCPIPPRQNRLPRKIEAGERYEGHP